MSSAQPTTDAPPPSLFARLKPVLQAMFLVLVFVFLALYLADQWDAIREETLTLDWRALILAQGVLTVAWLLLPLVPYLVLDQLGTPLPRLTVWRIFYVASVAKYLPGGIWALPGKVFLYQRAGVDGKRSVLAVFWEVLILVIAAFLMAIPGASLVADVVSPVVVVGVIVLGLLAFVAGLLWLRGAIQRQSPMLMRLPRLLRDLLINPENRLPLNRLTRLIAIYALKWLIVGTWFALLVAGVSPQYEAAWTLPLIGLHSGAWVAGFLFILSPGGIGIRDGLIILGTSVLIDDPIPAVIAIAARISWTLAEAYMVLLTLLVARWGRQDTA